MLEIQQPQLVLGLQRGADRQTASTTRNAPNRQVISVIFVTKIKTRTRIIGRRFQRTRTRIIVIQKTKTK